MIELSCHYYFYTVKDNIHKQEWSVIILLLINAKYRDIKTFFEFARYFEFADIK